MESALEVTAETRAQLNEVSWAAVAAQMKVQKLGSPLKLEGVLEGIAKAREHLQNCAVLGKVENVSPLEGDLWAYVEAVMGSKPLNIKMKADFSFMITMKDAEAAKSLVAATDLFQDSFYIHLEAWSKQKFADRTEFLYRLLWVQLVDLREDCIGIAEAIAAEKVCTRAER